MESRERLKNGYASSLPLLCLAGLTAGLNDVPHIAAASVVTSIESDTLGTIRTTVPFLLGTILAVAFLNPLPRAYQYRPSTQLSLSNLLIALVHTSKLFFPQLWDLSDAFTIMEHMLLGISKVLNLAFAFALCHGGTASINVTYAATALGVAFRITTLGLEKGGFVSPVISNWFLVITPLLSATGLVLSTTRLQDTDRDGEREAHNHSKQITKGGLDRGNIHHCHPLPSPPTTDFTNPLPAVFTLAHQATVPLIISLLRQSFTPVSQHTVADNPPTDEIPTLRVLIAASLWIGLAFGYALAPVLSLSVRGGRYRGAGNVQRQGGERLRESGSVDEWGWPRPLTIAFGVIFCMLTLSPASLWTSYLTGWKDNAVRVPTLVISGLVGIMVGLLYPSAGSSMAGVVNNGMLMPEQHDLGSAGVIVTFRTAGAVFGLMVVQLAECLDVPILLRLAVAASCWGMVVC